MSHLLESLMYQASQVFLFPTLLVITVLFVYAFFLLGMFAMQWWQRRQGQGGQPTRGHHLLAWAQAQPGASGAKVVSTWDFGVPANQAAWKVLETFDLVRRIDRVLDFLNQRLGVLRPERRPGIHATRSFAVDFAPLSSPSPLSV